MLCERVLNITDQFTCVRIRNLLFVLVILAFNYSHFVDELASVTVFLASHDLFPVLPAFFLPESRASFRSYKTAFRLGFNASWLTDRVVFLLARCHRRQSNALPPSRRRSRSAAAAC